MKYQLFFTFFSLATFVCTGQEKVSKGDNFFNGYEYQKAIEAYGKERSKKPLTNYQLLNLADAYFKLGAFENASKIYLDINKKDTIMSTSRFNRMLQSLSKSSDKARVLTFLRRKSDVLSSELSENAEFNYELMANAANSATVPLFNAGVNSPQADISPAFYKDSLLLFSSSRTQKTKDTYVPTGESYLDIYTAKANANGVLTNAKVLSDIPFSKYHKSTPFYSEKSSRLFYILSNTIDGELAVDPKGKNALAIGMQDGDGKFQSLLKDLSTSFYYPFFDETMERLYFAATFDDSYGGTDLYYVTTNNGQIMSAPTNLGPRINSPGNEIAPYVFEGDLYFSSDVFYGLGGMDVYRSNQIGNGMYSIPVNLGEGINSTADDFGFIIKAKGKDEFTGYLASNRKGGKGGDDIYGFNLKKIPGLKTFLLTGEIMDISSQNGIGQVQITVLDNQGNVIKELLSKEDGSFTMEIPWREQVTIKGTKQRYSLFSSTLNEEDMAKAQQSLFKIDLVLLDNLLEEKEGQTVVKLNKFYFAKGGSTVTPDIALELDKVVQTVANFPALRLAIATHTDSRGSSSYNLKLSKSRSDAVKFYLLKKGVPESAIVESLGYGEEKLTNNCVNGAFCLDFLHKQNERTLIKVFNMD